jgi:hypothetical protein
MIIRTVLQENDMEVKLIIDGNESRNVTGIIPSEGNVVELIKDGKKKLFNVVLVKYVYDLKSTNEPLECNVHLSSVELDDLDMIGIEKPELEDK